jgi:hypothetical protein
VIQHPREDAEAVIHHAPPPAAHLVHPLRNIQFDIDWRDRFGSNWVTGIRNQNPSSNCWAFATVALVESAVRIQHNMWTVLSEGDLRDSWSNITSEPPVEQHGAGLGDAMRHAKDNAIADPGCWPWTVFYNGYSPSSDRSGRSVRLGELKLLSGDTAIRDWVRDRGPVAAHVTFEAAGSGSLQGNQGAIVKDTGAKRDQLHDVLIVGYSQSAQCWLVKNSWGVGWGDDGFGVIAYGSCEIGTDEAFGLETVNPDPYTKRRLHNGSMVQSGAGALHRNFELVTGSGHHAWRTGGEDGKMVWDSYEIADEARGKRGVFLMEPAITMSTFNRNIEVVGLEFPGRLQHWWLDVATGKWHEGPAFGDRIDGHPGLIQSEGAPGPLEVVVRGTGGQLVHLWRDGGTWRESTRFASGVRASGPAFVQSTFGRARRNFEVVCVLDDGTLEHWWRDNDDPATPWRSSVRFGSGIGETSPCMIQSEYERHTELQSGNLELVVAAGGQAQHWWRGASDGQWRMSGRFGTDIEHVRALVYSSWGNLEVIAERSRDLRLYTRDGKGWHDGGPIPI